MLIFVNRVIYFHFRLFRWHGGVQIESSLDDDPSAQDNKKKDETFTDLKPSEQVENITSNSWVESELKIFLFDHWFLILAVRKI